MDTLKEFLSSKKKFLLIIALLVITIIVIEVIFGMVQENIEEERLERGTGIKNIYANISTSVMKGNKNGIEEFMKLAEEKNITFSADGFENCFNVTPDIVSENSNYRIFKFNDNADSYLVYENEIYKIGINKRDKGITSFAIADINEDNIPELFYSYRWKVSEEGRTNISYFDPVKKEEIGINKNYENVILINKNNELTVCNATLSNDENNTNFTMNSRLEEDVLVNVDGTIKPMTRLQYEEMFLKGIEQN